MNPVLRHVQLPDFGRPTLRPDLPDGIHGHRLRRFAERLDDDGFDAALVYADREHSANLAYLTGFDPRFEEALLVVTDAGDPLILVGNECMGIADAAPLPMRVELFQEFSLPSQPRDRSRPLATILAAEGIGRQASIAVLGWKESADPSMLEIPTFIVDVVRELVGDPALVVNANSILTSSDGGMRTVNEVEQLAQFEYAACHTSSGVRDLLFGLRVGMREDEAVRLLQWDGSPLSCHLMLSSGERAGLGLLSPTDRRIQRGDRFTTAYGVWGALNCRAGFVVERAEELPSSINDYVERLVAPYFAAIVEWYEALHVGQSGGVLFDIIDQRIGDPFFGVFLNPGHQLHLDEWVNSPIFRGSSITLRSGAALQVDVIPATGSDYFTTNIEDGVVLADADLRGRFSSKYPEAWTRILERRRFMSEVIGIDLHDDVLPLSNIPAYLAPFLLSPELAMVVR